MNNCPHCGHHNTKPWKNSADDLPPAMNKRICLHCERTFEDGQIWPADKRIVVEPGSDVLTVTEWE